MKSKIFLLLVGTLALTLLTACGAIKSLFPDKEKDYQYTMEIPPLILPPDLAKDSSLKLMTRPEPTKPNDAPTAPVQETAAPETEMAASSLSEPAPALASKTNVIPIKREAIAATLQKSADGAAVLRLEATFESAWRAIDKALSRKSIEVTQRDKAAKSFNLHYDPDEKALEDHSFWHEAFFMFNSLNSNEQEFIVKLTEQDQQTDVIVLDKDQKPAQDASAMRLLTLLQETIKSDFAK